MSLAAACSGGGPTTGAPLVPVRGGISSSPPDPPGPSSGPIGSPEWAPSSPQPDAASHAARRPQLIVVARAARDWLVMLVPFPTPRRGHQQWFHELYVRNPG